jgi:1,4-alpha-glucan branching enzyme
MNNKTKSSQQPKGYLCLVLHAHLPFVRHPECDYMMEENWLYEALTETYIPLLAIFDNLVKDRVPFRITMSLTPPLCTMLSDHLLQERYSKHLVKLIELAEKEIARTKRDPAFNKTAIMYLEKLYLCKNIFENVYDGNILKGFKAFQDLGVVEIVTCGATHGYLPNMQVNPNAVRAQIKTAVNSYQRFLGRKPEGIWLPECGFYPGLENILHEANIRYFFTETHGILCADPKPLYGVFAPVYCKEAPVAAFGRDVESSRSVWSAQEGYPGHAAYRDFYRDIGFDLDVDYIAPYIDPIGIRINTGFKYYRITGKKTTEKEPYIRDEALKVAAEHAGNFMFNREQQAEYLSSIMDRPPVIVAPYDAELFGHWWYEGPEWLNFLIRKIAFEQQTISLITPSDYLSMYPTNQICEPSFSSWGEGGYSEVWLDQSNDWIYRHLHRMEERMVEYARLYPEADGLLKRSLNQMARELLLAESSDWAFIMKNGTMVQYAVRRTKEHIANFLRLYDDIKQNTLDGNFVSLLESHNNIFPEINYKVYS